MNQIKRSLLMMVILASIVTVLGAHQNVTAQDKRVLNIYSSRHYGAVEIPITLFEEQTGIEVRISQGSAQDLLARLRAEGDRTPADMLVAIDAGVLSLAKAEGLLQPIESEILNANIDVSQRDPEGYWYGLSQRLRAIVYNPANVTQEEVAQLNTYADLANPIWQGRLCLRPATHIYSISLASSLVYHLGEDATKAIFEGWAANTTTYVDSDTELIEAVAAGECDVTLANQYYLARLISNGDPVAESVQLKWVDQDGFGNFYNINGAGVTASAQNVDEAIEFIEYMSSLEGQSGELDGFPGSNFEYPTNFAAEVNEYIAEFGEVKLDLDYPLWEYGAYQEPAIRLLEEAGYGFAATNN